MNYEPAVGTERSVTTAGRRRSSVGANEVLDFLKSNLYILAGPITGMVHSPTNGKYEKGDYKHDCPRPLTGCDFPSCSCDVDDNELSHKEVQQIEGERETVEKARRLVDDE